MAQVIRPQNQNNDLSNLLTIGGAVIGAGSGPGGAAAGAGLGQMAGGIMQPQQPPQQNPESGGGQASAMARRQQQMSQDNLATLKQAEAALPSLPEGLRQQYSPAIIRARMMEQQNRGMA
jgi:hypothetical protein